MENDYYFLERKIRTLENKKSAIFKTLAFSTEDGFSPQNENDFTVLFNAEVSSTVFVEITVSSESDDEVTFKYNDVTVFKRSLKSGFSQVAETVDAKVGENKVTLSFKNGQTENLQVKISGYVEKISDKSLLTILNADEKTFVCHYDDSKNQVVIYEYSNENLVKLYQESDVTAAAISHPLNGDCDIALYTLNNSGTLYLKYLRGDLLSVTEAIKIATEVSDIAGACDNGGDAVYYLKNGRVYKNVDLGERVDTPLDLKNICKIYSTPNKCGLLITIGYDNVATLYLL